MLSLYAKIAQNILLEKTTHTKQQIGNKKIVLIAFDTWVKAAAVLLFLVTFTFIIGINLPKSTGEGLISQITKQNPLGQKSTIILPDSSIVTLNSGSSISYPEKFTGKCREVELVGEAYFEVYENKQHPFKVKSKEANS